MIDVHIHLDQYPREQLPDLINDWQSKGIKGVVAVATDLRSSYDTLELSESFPHVVFPCIGWHPEQRVPTEQEKLELLQLIKMEKERIVGIGEIGLPYYALQQLGEPPLEPYVELFTSLVQAAKKHDLPANIHAVYEKAEIAFNILQAESVKKAHFHWLKADDIVSTNIMQAGYYLSFTPEVCYRKRDEPLIKNIPLEQLLLETDGPWAFVGPFVDRQTTPLFLYESLESIAKIKGYRPEEIREKLRINACKFYGLHLRR